MKNNWTEAELKILRNFKGDSLPEIPGRSSEAVRQRMIRMGIRKDKSWKDEEVDLLKSSAREGKIPDIEGKSRGSVRNKMIRMGLICPSKKMWSQSEIEILLNHKEEGLPKVQGRSESSVRAKMTELGLIDGKTRRWSEKEIEELKSQAASSKDITIKNRTKKAVRQKLRILGLVEKKETKPWSDEEKKLLAELLKESKKVQIKGRSKNAVLLMTRQLGLSNKIKFWTEGKVELLKKLHAQGMTAREIAKSGTFGKSYSAIEKKLSVLGLTKKITRIVLNDITKSKLKKFLVENWEGRTPDELVLMWNATQSPKKSVNRQRIVRMLEAMRIKIHRSEVKRLNIAKKKEKEIFSSTHASPKSMDEKIRANRIKIMMERVAHNRDVFTGMDLTEEEILESEKEEFVKNI